VLSKERLLLVVNKNINMGSMSNPIRPKYVKAPEKGSFPIDHTGKCYNGT